VVAVRFLVDDAPAAEVSAAPWTLQLDAAALGAGDHALAAVALDAAGNAGRSATVTIHVEAAPGPGEDPVQGGCGGCSGGAGAPLSLLGFALGALRLRRRRG